MIIKLKMITEVMQLSMQKISKNHKSRHSIFFSYPISLLLGAVCFMCFALNAQAQTEADRHDRFDGSEFNPTSFREASFDKQTYKDNEQDGSSHRLLRAETEEVVIRPGTSVLGKLRKNDVSSVTGETTEKSAERIFVKSSFVSELKPVVDLPGDWVPDKIDLTSNGGFSNEPFNGTPVPYTLNGHPEIQRGRP